MFFPVHPAPSKDSCGASASRKCRECPNAVLYITVLALMSRNWNISTVAVLFEEHRGGTLTRKHHRWNVYDLKTSPSHLHRRPYAHEQRHKFETKNRSRNGTRCSTYQYCHGLKNQAPTRRRKESQASDRRLIVLSPHSSPYCHSPYKMRERLPHTVTMGFSGSSNSATRPHASPGITYQELCDSSKLLPQAPTLPGGEKSFGLINFAHNNVLAQFRRRRAFVLNPRIDVAVPVRAFWAATPPCVSRIK